MPVNKYLSLLVTFDRILVESKMNLYRISFLQKMKYLKHTRAVTPGHTLPPGHLWMVLVSGIQENIALTQSGYL